MSFILLSSLLVLVPFELLIVGLQPFNLNQKMFPGWSSWWDDGPDVYFLILHGKHVIHKCYVKEAIDKLRVMACDPGGRRAEEEE